MPRCARLVIPGVAHNLGGRGVNGCRLFRHGFDKQRYLNRAADLAVEEGVIVHGYSLMTNHVHFLATPTRKNSLARFFLRLNSWWASFYNRKIGRTGPLFEGRYYSSPVDEQHFWAALRYIELNPKRAGLVKNAGDWLYSSARAHLGIWADPFFKLATEAIEHRRWSAQEWAAFLEEKDPESEMRLRRAQSGCRPCGAPAWIESLERRFGRRLALRNAAAF